MQIWVPTRYIQVVRAWAYLLDLPDRLICCFWIETHLKSDCTAGHHEPNLERVLRLEQELYPLSHANHCGLNLELLVVLKHWEPCSIVRDLVELHLVLALVFIAQDNRQVVPAVVTEGGVRFIADMTQELVSGADIWS